MPNPPRPATCPRCGWPLLEYEWGDWACFRCGHRMYNGQPLALVRQMSGSIGVKVKAAGGVLR